MNRYRRIMRKSIWLSGYDEAVQNGLKVDHVYEGVAYFRTFMDYKLEWKRDYICKYKVHLEDLTSEDAEWVKWAAETGWDEYSETCNTWDTEDDVLYKIDMHISPKLAELMWNHQ